MKRISLLTVFFVVCSGLAGSANDWPQLQGNASRTGSTTDVVAPPYKLHWAWMGPGNTQTALPLSGGSSLTIAGRVQAVVSGGSVFVGSMEGTAYAINATNGSTVWSASIPGGTVATAAVAGGVVVFVTTKGVV